MFLTLSLINNDTAQVDRFSTKDLADAFAVQQAPQDCRVLASQLEVEALPTAELISLHNVIAKPVNKFADRKTAIRRTLAAIEALPLADEQVEPLRVAAPEPVLEVVTPVEPTPEPVAEKPKTVAAKRAKLQAIVDAAKTPKTPAPKRERGVNLSCRVAAQVYPARAGSKQAAFIELLSRPCGATMPVLLEAMSRGGKPWTEASVKTGLNWDVHTVKGYGVRTEFHNGEGLYRLGYYDEAQELGFSCDKCGHPDEADEAEVTKSRAAPGYDAERVMAVYYLVMPEGWTAPLPHKEVKTAKANAKDQPALPGVE